MVKGNEHDGIRSLGVHNVCGYQSTVVVIPHAASGSQNSAVFDKNTNFTPSTTLTERSATGKVRRIINTLYQNTTWSIYVGYTRKTSVYHYQPTSRHMVTDKTRSQAFARIADRTAKNCRGHVT